ncbi:MAG: nucleotidyl transferase AbiEii/AbiGii toxin family protein [Saprospiraceae bacterium]|nr:nucleotidyl transferase AbiEii/AbiGii toxin family protein [Saprospiraceae bacterium]
MEIKDYVYREMLAYEAFIRRASQINLPFMLKGSYVTRQYFQNPNDRIPGDLDWVYMDTLEDESTARQKFDEWATLVTELALDDNVTYISFKQNAFWRRIDYAMADDFPTINTDLACWVGTEKLNFGLDISFNLDIEQPPVPLMYHPLEGAPFLVPNTVPISLQVSWKIHQTLVRPRFKDLFDLIHLVQYPTFDKDNLDRALQALINECSADNVDLSKLKCFLNYEISELFPDNSIDETWEFWRHDVDRKNYGRILYHDSAKHLTDVDKLPIELSEFLEVFKMNLENAGFGMHLFDNLPKPTRNKRKTFEQKKPVTILAPSNNSAPDENGHGDDWTIAGFFKKLFKSLFGIL